MTVKFVLIGAVSGLILGLILGPVLAFLIVNADDPRLEGDSGIAIPIMACMIIAASTFLGAMLANAIAQTRNINPRK